MQVALFYGPGIMKIEERPVPEPRSGEVLLKIGACAICGTDLRIFHYGHKNVTPPQVIGHEIAGEIVKLGEGVGGYKVGDRVIAVTAVGCGHCRFCQRGIYNLCSSFRALGYNFPGGFAEYMIIPAEAVRQGNLLKIPPTLPLDEASLVEPLSCCINGQEYLSMELGERVVIFGAGPIGCMHVELARARGASLIILIDVLPERLAIAKRFSADHFLNGKDPALIDKVLSLTDGEGADLIIAACSAKKAQEDSLKVAAKKARISFFAGLPKDDPVINFDSNILHYKEISVYGAFASYHSQYQKALALVAHRRIDMRKFITGRVKLSEIEKGFKLAESGEGLKVVVEP